MSVPSAVSSPSSTTFPSLEGIFGPLLIGTLLSAALWGVTCVHTYDYFVTPNEDRLWQKLIVALLWILDTFDTLMSSHVLYHYLIKNFTNPYALVSTTWSTSGRSLLNVLSSFIVCAMFARRIYLVSGKNLTLTLWIMAISSVHLVVGTLITVKWLIGLNSDALPSITHLLYLAFSLGIASDLSVTLALYWLLHSVKTGIRKTDTLVKVLILYIVTTGLLVVVDATLGMIFYIVMPNNLVYMVFFMLLGKLYINAFLVSLNARENLRKNQTDVVISLSRLSYTGHRQTIVITDDDQPSFRHFSMERRATDHEVNHSVSFAAV